MRYVTGLRVVVAADVTVTELQLEDGGIQRVFYASPANPRAALIMLPGGNCSTCRSKAPYATRDLPLRKTPAKVDPSLATNRIR